MSGGKGVGTTDTHVCTVSWCMGRDTPQVCGGRDHMATVDYVSATGADPLNHRGLVGAAVTYPDVRVCASTIGRLGQDVVTVGSGDDAWEVELRPFEARELAESLLRHAALLEAERATR